jgi:uncharacterized protein
MRITTKMQEYFRSCIKPNDMIYLFGSRVDDNKKGGDIDIFILSKQKYTFDRMRKIKIDFMKKFGWQKLDLINWTFNEKNSFKHVALQQAIKI